jgi:sterol desaturase/sphingolipid hydroxylase (fatty acid hydroxylase superfamily)
MLVNIGAILLVASAVLNGTVGEDYHRITGGGIVLGVILVGFFSYKRNTLEAEQKNPELLRKKNIEENDERNIIIRDKSWARANNIVGILIFAAILALSFFDVGWQIPVALAAIIVINGVLFAIYHRYYNKRL